MLDIDLMENLMVTLVCTNQIALNETQITLHFLSGSDFYNARDKSRFIIGST